MSNPSPFLFTVLPGLVEPPQDSRCRAISQKWNECHSGAPRLIATIRTDAFRVVTKSNEHSSVQIVLWHDMTKPPIKRAPFILRRQPGLIPGTITPKIWLNQGQKTSTVSIENSNVNSLKTQLPTRPPSWRQICAVSPIERVNCEADRSSSAWTPPSLRPKILVSDGATWKMAPVQ